MGFNGERYLENTILTISSSIISRSKQMRYQNVGNHESYFMETHSDTNWQQIGRERQQSKCVLSIFVF